MTAKNNYTLATLGDWFKILCQPEQKPKPITLSMHILFFFHPLSKLQVIVRNSDWFMLLFASVVIGRREYSLATHLKTTLTQ